MDVGLGQKTLSWKTRKKCFIFQIESLNDCFMCSDKCFSFSAFRMHLFAYLGMHPTVWTIPYISGIWLRLSPKYKQLSYIYMSALYYIYMGYRWEKRPLINWDAHSESSVTAALGGTCAVERKRTQRNLPSLEARKRVCYLMVNSIRLHKDLMGFIGYFQDI